MNFQHIGVDRENTYHALANNNGELVAINSFATKNNQHGLVNLSIYDPQDGTFFSKTQTGHGDISLRFTGEVGRLITNQFQGPFHPSYISEIGNNGNVSSSLTLTNARESLDATAKIGARNILGPISAVAGMRYNQNHGIDAIPLTLQATHKGEHLGAYFEITHNVLTKNTGAYLSVQYQL